MNDSLLKFSCRHCGALLAAAPTAANRTKNCPKCHSQVLVPEVGSAEHDEDEYSLCEGVDQPAADVAAVHQQTIAVVCLLCETRMHATVDQVGEQIQCPDCGRKQLVPPPPATPIRKTAPMLDSDNSEDYLVRDKRVVPAAATTHESDANDSEFNESNVADLACSACGAEPGWP